MRPRKPVILIGPVCNDPAESVSAVNRALVQGLSEHYTFVTSNANRRYGTTGQSRFNGWNIYYLTRHFLTWVWNLVRSRPQIAHYAINGGWALWKGLLFLKVARWCGARTVGHLHSGGFLDYWNTLPESKRQKALRDFARLDAFVVLSTTWHDAMASKVGVPAEKLHIVNNPIDATFEDEALRMPIQRDGGAILAMGVMGTDKGVLDLVDAAAEIRRKGIDFRLHLAGPEREPGILARIRHQVAASNLTETVDIPGSVRGQAKLDLFRATTISVLPSYYENFPLVLLEAAAAGHAIITTPVGAVPEFFRDGESAIFIEPRNPQELAAALERLLSNPAELRRLGQAARAMFLQHLTRPAIMSSLNRVYSMLRNDPQSDLQLRTQGADAL